MASLDLRFRVPPALEAELRSRDQEFDPRAGAQHARKDSAGLIARRDLGRYYALLESELAALSLTEGEASLICDANNGLGSMALALTDDASPRCAGVGGWLRAALLANVSDAVTLNAYDTKHGLTAQEATGLLERMRRWTPGQVLAVADAMERFWAAQGATVESVGLVRGGAGGV